MEKVKIPGSAEDAREELKNQTQWPNTSRTEAGPASQSTRGKMRATIRIIKRHSRHKNVIRQTHPESRKFQRSISKNEQLSCKPIARASAATPLEPLESLFLESVCLPSIPRTALHLCTRMHQKLPTCPIKLPLLLTCLVVALSTATNLVSTSVGGIESKLSPQQVTMDRLLDLDSGAAFAPTRRPTREPLAQNATDARLLRRRDESTTSGSAGISAADEQAGDGLARSASSKTPFTRTNELDVFLDDMNHKELRTVASGGPISDLFQPKALAPLSGLGSADAKPGREEDNSQSRGLMGSQSEQQIYSECALILQRTYVKNVDDPNHQLVPFGKTEQACISYKQIDKAVEQAKHRLKFRDFARMRKRPLATAGRPLAPLDVIHKTLEPPEDLVAAIGELNMATTQILADQFELSNDELLNGLPLIDMSKTKFWPLCPLLVRQDLACKPSRFRTFTGHCNNLEHPTWGAAMTPYARYLPPMHPDGIWVARKSVVSEISFELGEGHHETHASADFEGAGEPQVHHHVHFASHRHERAEPRAPAGSVRVERRYAAEAPSAAASSARAARSVAQELPSARLVSALVHRDVDRPSHDLSLAFVSWGQVINHDMTRAAQPPSSIRCCGEGRNSSHKLCLPIRVAASDPFYGQFGVRCLEFRRSLAGVRPNCVLGPRVHQNSITHLVDASFVYGSSRGQADSLRLFRGGRLRDRDWFRREGLKPLLPAQELEPDLECLGRPRHLFCFLAGDVRANEQTQLTVLHTVYMREHNRLADRLAQLNPHWSDERTYHEARHIVAAGVQHVLLTEYLPLLIGPRMAQLYNLTAEPRQHWAGYEPGVTASVSNGFAAAAFRQGHSFVQGTIERHNRNHEFVAAERLRHLFKQPFLLYQPGVVDELLLGMLGQPAQSHDPFISEDVSGHLFQPPELQFGHDLAAINIQRGRDQGLPGYNLWREWCGLPRAHSFDQLAPYLSNQTAHLYARLYKHVDDIDLWSAGVSERRLPGAAIGPTFACIIARQFSNSRRGDRFWYENGGLASSFTPDQLAQIRRLSLARLLCANADDVPTVQRWALRLAHPVLNPRLPCDQLPDLDLQYWQEE